MRQTQNYYDFDVNYDDARFTGVSIGGFEGTGKRSGGDPQYDAEAHAPVSVNRAPETVLAAVFRNVAATFVTDDRHVQYPQWRPIDPSYPGQVDGQTGNPNQNDTLNPATGVAYDAGMITLTEDDAVRLAQAIVLARDEVFDDADGDGKHDPGETFDDRNGNGTFDGPFRTWRQFLAFLIDVRDTVFVDDPLEAIRNLKVDIAFAQANPNSEDTRFNLNTSWGTLDLFRRTTGTSPETDDGRVFRHASRFNIPRRQAYDPGPPPLWHPDGSMGFPAAGGATTELSLHPTLTLTADSLGEVRAADGEMLGRELLWGSFRLGQPTVWNAAQDFLDCTGTLAVWPQDPIGPGPEALGALQLPTAPPDTGAAWTQSFDPGEDLYGGTEPVPSLSAYDHLNVYTDPEGDRSDDDEVYAPSIARYQVWSERLFELKGLFGVITHPRQEVRLSEGVVGTSAERLFARSGSYPYFFSADWGLTYSWWWKPLHNLQDVNADGVIPTPTRDEGEIAEVENGYPGKILMAHGAWGGYFQWQLFLDTVTDEWLLSITENGTQWQDTGLLTEIVRGEWMHVAVTFRGAAGTTPGEAHLYVNGNAQATVPIEDPFSLSSFLGTDRIYHDFAGHGRRSLPAWRAGETVLTPGYYNAALGTIDDVQAFADDLPSTSIVDLYERGRYAIAPSHTWTSPVVTLGSVRPLWQILWTEHIPSVDPDLTGRIDVGLTVRWYDAAAGQDPDDPATWSTTSTFTDPDAFNRIVDASGNRIETDRYRVEVEVTDANGGDASPPKLLDTPVIEDIRVLNFEPVPNSLGYGIRVGTGN